MAAGPVGRIGAMTEISDRYRRLADLFAATVAAVPDDRWGAPSPCEDWTARDVLRHVVDNHTLFFGFVDRKMPEGPSVDDDPVGAFAHARACMLDELEDPERAGTEYEGMFGTRTFEWAVDQFLSGDLMLHRWDLGTAAGLDVEIPRQDIEQAWKDAEFYGDSARAPGVFGPALDPPADADEQTKLLAFTGRRAW
jgi:uncharacterized protein (TIGR03086 family)